MNKLHFFIIALLTMILASCSGGYDQKKVDALDKKDELSKADYELMIEQANYALDDLDKYGDVQKWANENAKEAESLAGMIVALGFCSELDNQFPESLKDELKALDKRTEKYTTALLEIASKSGGVENTESEEYEGYEEGEDEPVTYTDIMSED